MAVKKKAGRSQAAARLDKDQLAALRARGKKTGEVNPDDIADPLARADARVAADLKAGRHGQRGKGAKAVKAGNGSVRTPHVALNAEGVRPAVGEIGARLWRLGRDVIARGFSYEGRNIQIQVTNLLKAVYGHEYSQELEDGIIFGPRGRRDS